VIVTWVAPDDGGSPITGYTVLLRHNDGLSFSVDIANCDMSSSTDVTCTIPVTALKAEPFSIDWGTGVYAKVYATNIYGDSSESEAGNGAVILTAPSAPTDLAENLSDRSTTTLGFTWVAPSFIGGSIVIDYRVSMAIAGQSFSVLDSSVTDTAYLASGLVSGTNYEFRVEARNAYGYSELSDVLPLLCAFIPYPPTSLSALNTEDSVTVTWTAADPNGTPITSYKVLVEDSTDSSFYEVTCQETAEEVLQNRQCEISLEQLELSPWFLTQGHDINIHVVSVNIYGESVPSATITGYVTLFVEPDAPVALANDPALTSDVQIAITWADPVNNGGTPILDYAVYFDQSSDDFVLLDGAVTQKNYLTTVTLIAGAEYKFKV
jgi:hypothetical protein